MFPTVNYMYTSILINPRKTHLLDTCTLHFMFCDFTQLTSARVDGA